MTILKVRGAEEYEIKKRARGRRRTSDVDGLQGHKEPAGGNAVLAG